jgi:hypothetical protein
MSLFFFAVFLMRAPWRIHQEQDKNNKEKIAALEKAGAEETSIAYELCHAAERARDEALAKAAAIPTPPDKIKNILHNLGVKSKELRNANGDVGEWFERVRVRGCV